jgi:hypothetical protein
MLISHDSGLSGSTLPRRPLKRIDGLNHFLSYHPFTSIPGSWLLSIIVLVNIFSSSLIAQGLFAGKSGLCTRPGRAVFLRVEYCPLQPRITLIDSTFHFHSHAGLSSSLLLLCHRFSRLSSCRVALHSLTPVILHLVFQFLPCALPADYLFYLPCISSSNVFVCDSLIVPLIHLYAHSQPTYPLGAQLLPYPVRQVTMCDDRTGSRSLGQSA